MYLKHYKSEIKKIKYDSSASMHGVLQVCQMPHFCTHSDDGVLHIKPSTLSVKQYVHCTRAVMSNHLVLSTVLYGVNKLYFLLIVPSYSSHYCFCKIPQ